MVDFEPLSDSKIVEFLWYGDSQGDDNQNASILPPSTSYVEKTKRFDCSLFN